MRRMVTPKQLAEMLQQVNVGEVAKATGLSTKTIYRLRNQEHAPNLETVLKLLDAIKASKPRKPKTAKA